MDGSGLFMSIMTVMAGLTWLLMLAGAGSLQKSCDDASRLVVGPSTTCHIVYRYQWWLIAFYLAVHVGIVIAAVMAFVDKNRIAICTFLGIVTAMLMDNANTFLNVRDQTDGSMSQQAALFSAGCSLAAAVNIMLIAGYGHRGAPDSLAGMQLPNGEPFKMYHNQMTAALHPSCPSASTAAPPV